MCVCVFALLLIASFPFPFCPACLCACVCPRLLTAVATLSDMTQPEIALTPLLLLHCYHYYCNRESAARCSFEWSARAGRSKQCSCNWRRRWGSYMSATGS